MLRVGYVVRYVSLTQCVFDIFETTTYVLKWLRFEGV